MRAPSMSRIDILRANLPGTLRVSLFVYDTSGKTGMYRPIVGRHIRISADSPDQEQQLFAALVKAVKKEVGTWPPVGDGIEAGFGIETDGGDEGADADG